MRSSHWLSAMFSALTALGLITCHAALANTQEQDDKKPAVIILKLQTSEVPGKEEGEKGDDQDEDEDDEKEMKQDDDEDDDDDDKEAKSKKKKEKKAKHKKAAKKPKSKPDSGEERRPERRNERPAPREEMREGRPNPDRPERGFQFRWEGEGPRPPRREEGRGGPPEEMRHQMEQQREQMMLQREEMERRADEMRQQAERMRREVEERARQSEQSRDQSRQIEQKANQLAVRLKETEQALEQRSQEVRKLKVALEERERAIIELKQALAKQSEKLGDVVKPKQPQKVAGRKPIDPALIARVEKLEAEIRKLMVMLKQQSQPKPQPKVIEQPKVKVGEIKEQTSKPKVTVPDGGTFIMGGAPRRGRAAPIVSAAPRSPSFNSKIQSLTRGIRPENSSANPLAKTTDVPPPTPLPDPDAIAPAAVKPVGAIDAASVGGVGIVEGDVVALLPQEGKFVLKVSTWHDGKQVRADWVGQQVSINQGNLPAVKPGDHVSLDARIEGQKGLVWGGKVFQTK